MRRTLPAAALALVALTACQTSETAEQMAARMQAESDSAKASISAISDAFERHVAAGHFDSAAMIYTADATIMPPDMPAVSGRQAIQTWMGQGGPFQLTLTTLHVAANGPMAVEHGTFAVTMTPPGASAPVSSPGKFLAYWTKTSDGWKMAWDIWNNDAPMAPPAPAPARRPS